MGKTQHLAEQHRPDIKNGDSELEMSDSHIEGGYILLARQLLRSGIMNKPALNLKLFIWMLERAHHKNGVNGLNRGQFVTSIAQMRDAMSYYVGYRKVTPSAKEIRTIYEGLREALTIDTTKVTGGMVITILNYEKFQNQKNYEGHNEKFTKGTTGAHSFKGSKNEKNVIKLPPTPQHGGADAIYDFYVREIDPQQKTRQRGLNNIRYWLKRYPASDLKKAVCHFKPIASKRERQYRNDPANFFGQKDPVFRDYLAPPAPAPSTPSPKNTLNEIKAPAGWSST